jgi:hypothetical protein
MKLPAALDTSTTKTAICVVQSRDGAAGRANFEQMVRYLKTHVNVRTLLEHLTKRLNR